MAPSKAESPLVDSIWKVVGGATSGGIVVRSSSKVNSTELEGRLATGSLVHELELQGERLRYKRIRGSGPSTGWVSTKFKGKELLIKWPLHIGLLCAGSRGDLQPILALGLGLQRAGFRTSIWAHEGDCEFVRHYGLPCHDLFGSFHTEASSDHLEPLSEMHTWVARLKLSAALRCPVCGVNAMDFQGAPAQVLFSFHDWSFTTRVISCALFWTGQALQALGEMAAGRRLVEHAAAIRGDMWGEILNHMPTAKVSEPPVVYDLEAMANEFAAQLAAREVKGEFMPSEPAATDTSREADEVLGQGEGPERAPEAARASPELDAGAKAESTAQCASAGGPEPVPGPTPAADAAGPPPETSKDLWGKCVADWREKYEKVGMGIMGLGIERLDNERATRILREWEEEEVDVVLWHFGQCSEMAAALSLKYGIPQIPLGLYSGMDLYDPMQEWLTEEMWQTMLCDDDFPQHLQSQSLAQARQGFSRPPSHDATLFCTRAAIEEAALSEKFEGQCAIRRMGFDAFMRFSREGYLQCFLTSLVNKRVLSFMGDHNRKEVDKHVYTGFWIMDEKDQIQGSSGLFGGPEVREQIEAFVGAGSKPAYIGWGSMLEYDIGSVGMTILAVAALKQAQMRGIVLGGWAGLNLENVEKVVGRDDPEGLYNYAVENVLFVSKAPQTWLFPKCSVLVIHGGSGTLAAAWTSGVPVVVVPVTVDQPSNGLLNVIVGAGLRTRQLKIVSINEMATAMMQAATSESIRMGAQGVQLSMMRDKPIQRATEHIMKIMTKDVPSGAYKFVDDCERMARQTAAEIFEMFDQDGDGFWKWDEYSKWCKAVGQPEDVELAYRLLCVDMPEENPEDLWSRLEQLAERGIARTQIVAAYTDCRWQVRAQFFRSAEADLETCAAVTSMTSEKK